MTSSQLRVYSQNGCQAAEIFVASSAGPQSSERFARRSGGEEQDRRGPGQLAAADPSASAELLPVRCRVGGRRACPTAAWRPDGQLPIAMASLT
jgi:hypothetical protein